MADSAMVLSEVSPTVPMDGAAHTPSIQSVWETDVYCNPALYDK